MKKVLSIIIALVCVTTAVNAQITHQFSVQQHLPINPTYVANQGNAITDSFTITLTQGSLTPLDTFAFGSPITINAQNQAVVRLYWGRTKAQGDTINISYTNGVSFGQAGTYNYCVRAFMFNRDSSMLYPATFDTTGYRDCTTMTITADPTGLNDYFVKNIDLTKQKINVYPNPAVGNEINVDYVAQNNSEVIATVYDLTGRKVLSHSFGQAFKGQDGFGLNISALNGGMYILELRQDGIKATGQFVK